MCLILAICDLPMAGTLIISCKTVVYEEANSLKGEPGCCSSLNEHRWFSSQQVFGNSQ